MAMQLRERGRYPFPPFSANLHRTPRLARTVFAGLPHHVTQRGNRREDVFFTDEDRRAYLHWLKAYWDKHAVAILAHCLIRPPPIGVTTIAGLGDGS